MSNAEILTELRDALGVERFRAFCRQHNGQTVYFNDLAGCVSVMERNAAVRADFYGHSNITIQDLATKYGISVSSVYKILENP